MRTPRVVHTAKSTILRFAGLLVRRACTYVALEIESSTTIVSWSDERNLDVIRASQAQNVRSYSIRGFAERAISSNGHLAFCGRRREARPKRAHEGCALKHEVPFNQDVSKQLNVPIV